MAMIHPPLTFSFTCSITILFIITILHPNCPKASASPPSCRPHDRDALLDFKNRFLNMSTGDYWFLPSWVDPADASNSTNANCCTWEGVICDDDAQGFVTGIDLNGCPAVRGKIDSIIGTVMTAKEVLATFAKLSRLSYLDLSCQFFDGSLPEEISIGNLTSLTHLNLSNNDFSGIVPESLGNRVFLQHLDLSYNALSGDLPESLGNFTLLQHLDLSHNQFSGPIPTTLGNLVLLQHLDLSSSNNDSVADSIVMSCHGFSGAIPASLGKLTHLQHLNLRENCLSGIVPESLGELTLLQHIDLSANNFSGIDFQSLTKLTLLKYLKLSGNKYLHSFPLPLDWLPSFQLHSLDLSDCSFYGTFPSWLRDQTDLVHLILKGNKFSGEIPSWAWQLVASHLDFSNNNFTYTFSCDAHVPFSSLTYINISSNPQIGGTFPCFIANMTSLQVLSVQGNSLTGPIPADLFLNLNLTSVELSNNRLGGRIPSSLLQLPFLPSLNLSYNNFTGSIPDVFSSLIGFQELDLSNNQLNGLLPASIQRLTFLGSLKLNNNQYSRQTIPSYIFQLPGLWHLDLSFNKFTGPIPDALPKVSQRINDYYLDLSNNELDGVLPPSMQYTSLQYLALNNNQFPPQNIPSYLFLFPRLSFVDLSSNNFTGISEFSNNVSSLDLDGLYYWGSASFKLSSNKLTRLFDGENIPQLASLVALDVSDNMLRGTFPPSLAEIVPNLQILNMSKNQLQGPVPNFVRSLNLIRELDLGSNELNGSIPEWIANLSNLQALILTGNNLIGTIPASLGNLTAMQNIKSDEDWNGNTIVLDLSRNQLSGPIPPELGKLKILHFLNLSRNNLEGQIPSTLGNLNNLESLDLSGNQLQGQIPSSFQDLLKLEFVNLSSNHLSGNIPSSPQWDSFEASSFLNNDGLCISSPTSKARLPPCVFVVNNGPDISIDSSSPTVDATFLSDTVEWGAVGLGYPLGLMLGLTLFTYINNIC